MPTHLRANKQMQLMNQGIRRNKMPDMRRDSKPGKPVGFGAGYLGVSERMNNTMSSRYDYGDASSDGKSVMSSAGGKDDTAYVLSAPQSLEAYQVSPKLKTNVATGSAPTIMLSQKSLPAQIQDTGNIRIRDPNNQTTRTDTEIALRINDNISTTISGNETAIITIPIQDANFAVLSQSILSMDISLSATDSGGGTGNIGLCYLFTIFLFTEISGDQVSTNFDRFTSLEAQTIINAYRRYNTFQVDHFQRDFSAMSLAESISIAAQTDGIYRIRMPLYFLPFFDTDVAFATNLFSPNASTPLVLKLRTASPNQLFYTDNASNIGNITPSLEFSNIRLFQERFIPPSSIARKVIKQHLNGEMGVISDRTRPLPEFTVAVGTNDASISLVNSQTLVKAIYFYFEPISTNYDDYYRLSRKLIPGEIGSPVPPFTVTIEALDNRTFPRGGENTNTNQYITLRGWSRYLGLLHSKDLNSYMIRNPSDDGFFILSFQNTLSPKGPKNLVNLTSGSLHLNFQFTENVTTAFRIRAYTVTYGYWQTTSSGALVKAVLPLGFPLRV